MNNVFEPGTLIPRGKYIRQYENDGFDASYFAKQADKERDLRMLLYNPAVWLAMWFEKNPPKEEMVAFLENLTLHISNQDIEVSTLEEFIGEINERVSV